MNHRYATGDARANFKAVLDAAAEHLPVSIEREGVGFAVLEWSLAVELLSSTTRVPKPQVVAEDDAWSIFLPGVPVGAEGLTLEDAIADFIVLLRDYTADWKTNRELRLAPNHAQNAALILLVESFTDEDLEAWTRGQPMAAEPTTAAR